MANSCAVVIGVDAYQGTLELASACNDAVAFAETLVELELVQRANIHLLTLPARPAARAATDAAIVSMLQQLPEISRGFDRLFVFFSGHGIIARSGAVFRTSVLLPSYSGPGGEAVLDWQNVIDAMGVRGAEEQYWFLDACRELDLKRKRKPRKLKFRPEHEPRPRAQSWLYAVSFGGVARGVRAALGYATKDLLDALRGQGLAAEYNSRSKRCQVTMASICDELTRQACIRGDSALPVARDGEVKASPICELRDRSELDFTVFLKPRGFENAVRVSFSRDSERIEPPPGYGDPHAAYGNPVKLKPLRYEILATIDKPQPGATQVMPAAAEVDPRIENTLRVRLLDGQPTAQPRGGAVIPGSVNLQVDPGPPLARGVSEDEEPRLARVIAKAHDADTEIVLSQRDPPRQTHRARHMLDHWVPAGRYNIEFTAGGDVISRDELMLPAGSTATVTAHAATSSLTALLVGAPTTSAPAASDARGRVIDAPAASDARGRVIAPEVVVLSESIGPMQTHVAETILPLLGVKAFDPDRVVLQRAPQVVLQQRAEDYGLAPVSVVVGLEGDWTDAPRDVLTEIRTCLLSDTYPHVPASPQVRLRPLALGSHFSGTAEFSTAAFERIGITYHRAPGHVFGVRVGPLHNDYYDVRCAACAGHVTVVTVLYHTTGKPSLSVYGLPLPRWRNEGDPIGLEVRHRVVARTHLAQRQVRAASSGDWLGMLTRAAVIDPIDSVLAYYALETIDDGAHDRERIVRTLRRHLSWLPDASVLAALQAPVELRERILSRIIRDAVPPGVAQSAGILAEHARDYGLHAPWLNTLEEVLLEDQPLVITFAT